MNIKKNSQLKNYSSSLQVFGDIILFPVRTNNSRVNILSAKQMKSVTLGIQPTITSLILVHSDISKH